jgi:fructose-1,6-bisphosphatase/inositol monophosphatase family enzyme
MRDRSVLDHQLYDLATEASKIIRRGRKNGFEINSKPTKGVYPDYATPIDNEAQKFIIKTIKYFYPHAVILAEEGNQIPELISPYAMIWSVDPIDGTGDFIRGTNDVTVMISVQYEDLNAAIIYNPFTGDYIQLLSDTKSVAYNGNYDYPIGKINPNNQNIIGFADIRSFQGTPIFEKTFSSNGRPEFDYYNRSGSYGDLIMKLVTGQFCAIALTGSNVAPWDSLPGALILKRLGASRFELRKYDNTWNKNPILVSNKYTQNPMTILTIDSVAKKLGILF